MEEPQVSVEGQLREAMARQEDSYAILVRQNEKLKEDVRILSERAVEMREDEQVLIEKVEFWRDKFISLAMKLAER